MLAKLKFKDNYQVFIVLFVYGIIFCSISLVNHYNFRTAGYDLGITNNALYDYIHFRWNDGQVLNINLTNILSDHFTILPLLFSPFYWIFGTYTALIFQILGILWGGFGIYKIFIKITNNKRIAVLSIIHFFSIWGIYSALSFDYHDNVLGAMFVPWFIYFVILEKWRYAFIYWLLIIISKENIALWAIFICAGLFIHFFREKQKRIPLILFTLASFLFFVLVMKVIIPTLGAEGHDGKYLHFRFSAIGENMGEAMKTIITRPFYTFKLLFINHKGNPALNGIKTELHYVIMLSGGIALLLRPQFLLMLLPIYGQKLFNDLFPRWGLNGQYSIEFVPILTIALFIFIASIKKEKYKYLIALISVILTITITGIKLDKRVSKWYNPHNSQFWTAKHWKRPFNVKEIHRVINSIPENISVCADFMLVPHLTNRDSIYHFPVYRNEMEYVVLLPAANKTYLISKEKYLDFIETSRTDSLKTIVFDNDELIIIRNNR